MADNKIIVSPNPYLYGSNTYLITGGGIKLGATIQESPDLQDHVIQNIDKVRNWLKENGIMDANDMENG